MKFNRMNLEKIIRNLVKNLAEEGIVYQVDQIIQLNDADGAAWIFALLKSSETDDAVFAAKSSNYSDWEVKFLGAIISESIGDEWAGGIINNYWKNQ